MNEMMIFNNPEFGSVRTVCIDGEPWLVGKDVALILYKLDGNTSELYCKTYPDASRRNN